MDCTEEEFWDLMRKLSKSVCKTDCGSGTTKIALSRGMGAVFECARMHIVQLASEVEIGSAE